MYLDVQHRPPTQDQSARFQVLSSSIPFQRPVMSKSYPLQFPFKDPSCLTHNTPTMLKEMSKMHEDEAHDDNLIAMETSNQILTRAQMRAAKNAANSHILETADLNDDADPPLHLRNDTPAVPATNKARKNAALLLTILPLRATSDDDLAAAHLSVEHDEASICTQTWPITTNSKSQKHLQFILSRLACQNTTHQTTWSGGQDACCWSHGQENLIEESCLDCEIHLIGILEKCTELIVLHQPGTKD